MNNIEKVSFKIQKFRQRKDTLSPYIKPLCDHVVRNVFKEEVGSVFTEHFRHVTVKKEQFYYNSNSGEKYEGYDDDRNDNSETSRSSSYSKENEDDDSDENDDDDGEDNDD